ncbi:MAG: DUF1614 domain-containing protein [Vicinamibacterales bacterium]
MRLRYFPLAVPLIVAAVLLLGVLLLLIELSAIEYAYARVGVGHRAMVVILVLTLLGSSINIPLWRVRSTEITVPKEVRMFGVRWIVPVVEQRGTTIVAVNVGGAVIPVLLSARILMARDAPSAAVIATMIVVVVTYLVAKPVPGIGIVVPTLVPPVIAASAALLLSREAAPAVAYVAGTIGTLVGADLLNLRRVQDLGAPVVSIGGAGTFDGIFVTGILAVLLA